MSATPRETVMRALQGARSERRSSQAYSSPTRPLRNDSKTITNTRPWIISTHSAYEAR